MNVSPDAALQADDSFDRLDELLSLFFDSSLDEQQVQELNDLLANDRSARTRSVEMAQLHADLYEHFRRRAKQAADATTTVDLGLSIDGGYLPV